MSATQAVLDWWTRLWHRPNALTSDAERQARRDLIRALNGELDADVAEMQALLNVATGRQTQDKAAHR